MINKIAMIFAFAFFFVACGENKHSETLSDAGTQTAALKTPVSADAMAVDGKSCAPVDLVGVSGLEKIRFAAKVSNACASKNAVLLAKYPSTVFPAVSGVSCVLLRSQEELAKYGDFSFRCTGGAVVFPSLGGEFAVELPVVKGLDLSSVKLRLIAE
jgi:hypothetical protein